ncbi:1,2-diacylglycerol-3-glucose glucosyltransferase [Oscillibacter valericigenes Sjm18-20]|nr:1,2-diacylglycerol-3-glucose glucosyltransferase [Oscillibacter valericigenes Sjm18-20]
MSIQLYAGSLSLVRRSGVGQAVLHQQEMLSGAGISSTERFVPEARTVHVNTVLPDAPLAALRAHLAGKKVVYYGHSTEEDFRNSFKGSNLLAPLFRRWIKFCYERGDVVITPTPYSKQLLESYGIRRPIYALSNGVDTDFFAPSSARRKAFRKKYGIGEQEKAVLSVGHYIARKGLLEFVDMARKLPNIRFFWFGYTNLDLVPHEIRQAITEAPPNLVFPGYVDRAELRDAYCGCDVFAFMSHEETEGIVVLEALACGIPTVVRDIPVYRDWLTDGISVCKAKDNWDFLRKVSDLLNGVLPSPAAGGLEVARSRSIPAMGRVLRTIYELEGLPYQSPEEASGRKTAPAHTGRPMAHA